MKRPNSIRLSLTVAAAAGLLGMLISTSNCGVGPTRTPGGSECFTNPAPVCDSPVACGKLSNIPVCGLVGPGCGENNQCVFTLKDQPGCPCVERDTRPCTRDDGTPGTQTCGRKTNSATLWCPACN
jgi:hypothetical protein